VAATLEPGSSASAIAREVGTHPGQLDGWRRELRGRRHINFARVQITGEPAPRPAGLVGGGAQGAEFLEQMELELEKLERRDCDGRRGCLPTSIEIAQIVIFAQSVPTF
jgi:transposase-like protein